MALRCTLLRGLVVTFALVAVCLLAVAIGVTRAQAQITDEDRCVRQAENKNIVRGEDQTGPIIYGTPMSDHICGTPGDDVIVGGLLDDDIYGGGGDDIIIGGHGTDLLNGQGGNDWLRGGDNNDVYVGGANGAGNDTASFADLTPVGNEFPSRGVKVDLTASPPRAEIGDWLFDGEENGFTDELREIDDVVGTAFDDDIKATADEVTTLWGGAGNDTLRGTNNDELRGERGADTCLNNGNPLPDCSDANGPQQPKPAGSTAVYGEVRGKDRGIVVLGTAGNDVLSFARSGEEVQVTASGSVALNGPMCTGTAPVSCSLAAADAARYVVVWGDDGADTVTFGDQFQLGPGELQSGINGGTVDVNGGNGLDVLNGGPEDELLFSGESGDDHLNGGAGSDALISEGIGGDKVHAGVDDDQIVTDNACAGHELWGEGGDRDVIGFARQVHLGPEKAGVEAQLGQGSTPGQARAIRHNGEEVENCVPSILHGQAEVLEGTQQRDILRGNDFANTIWGRSTADVINGNGGDDRLWGHTGDDTIVGGQGADRLYGGHNSDSLDARDTPDAGDPVIDCGPDRDQSVQRDHGDRQILHCEQATQASMSVTGTLNGEPGRATVSGEVLTAAGEPARGYVTVIFDRHVNGTWKTERTAQRTLDDGHFEVEEMNLVTGLWSARVVFPAGQNSYDSSTFTAPNFEIKDGYQIVARHSGRCLDVYASGTANGQAIHQRDCLDPVQAPNQVFSLVPKWDDALQIVARHSGRCVDVAWESYDPGALLQQFDCDPAGWANQLWWRDQIATGSPYFQLEAEHSGQCMDLQDGGTANGVRAVQWPCMAGRQSQHWELRPVNSSPIPRNVPPGGFNTVTHAEVEDTSHGQPGLATVTGDVSVTNAPGETADGAYLHAYFSKWEDGQWVYKEAAVPTVEDGTFRVDDWRVSPGKWRVMVAIPAQGPYNHSQSAYHEFEIKSGYEIVARHSDKCMTLVPNATESGGSIAQIACTATPIETYQVFSLVPMGGGYHQVRINSTGGCLDVSWNSQDDGAYLQQWECEAEGWGNQLWKVVPVTGADPYVTLKAKHSGKCADVAWGSSAEEMFIQQWTCNSSYTHQHWTLQAVD
jgi:Ca2+-binding RTX toxin-like protein